jgi:hypothetical protein
VTYFSYKNALLILTLQILQLPRGNATAMALDSPHLNRTGSDLIYEQKKMPNIDMDL